ncbi:hypothetical protein Ccrd_008930 [Cynara cardunculus var. scolymus]|uniref:Uncharacterized protein n=1 Tax=Cynara cardunculus var. scolymus TaxID=59895 RepID=A0A103XE36_CYNCS|nr:hypothetical protein Ccrd_008930 [Cynara cardunculus var. scolymus]
MGDLYALDFDGVLCDSCGESSISAVKAAKVRWPELFATVDSAMEDWIVDQMHIVRPVVETGYENLLLVRLLLEMKIPSLCKSSVAEGLTIEGILENWSKIKPVIMEEWSENRDALVDLFGKVRDEWMEKDLATWVGANSFVEDRLATLKNVIKEPELNGWNLYLGDWGYNTQKEREEAATYSRIQILQLSDFSKKLK